MSVIFVVIIFGFIFAEVSKNNSDPYVTLGLLMFALICTLIAAIVETKIGR